MAYENIIYQAEGGVAVIKFNRPKALNALNPALMDEFGQALDQVKFDSSIKVLILTGEGDRAFVAGADIGYMVNLSPLEARNWSAKGHEMISRLNSLPIPVIACVNGFALGGGTEMAMANSASPRSTWGLSPGSAAPRIFPGWWAKGWPKRSA
jgi:enoyl-CoA hydratase